MPAAEGDSGVAETSGVPRRSRLRNRGLNLRPNSRPSAQFDNLSWKYDENDN
jgi:hypothetical protein